MTLRTPAPAILVCNPPAACPDAARAAAAGALLALAAGTALAQDMDSADAVLGSRTAAVAPAEPLWELGAFAVGGRQQAYPGARRQVGVGLALPYAIYRGRVLRADGSTLGVRALKTDRVEFDIGLAGSLGSSATDARRGMPALGTLVEFGPRLKVALGQGFRAALPLRGVFDVSDGLRHRGLAFEPEVGWRARSGPWRLGASLGWVFGDARLASTYYGVAPAYATADRPAYGARSGLISTRLSLSATRSLGPDWRVFGFVRLESLAGAANRDSPLVERRSGQSFGLGVSWTWLRSDAAAAP